MDSATGASVHLKDYTVPEFLIPEVELDMTDALAALTALANNDCPERKPALDEFYTRWKEEPLVVDKWLAVEALSRLPGTVTRVKELTSHPAFTLENPNKVYALIGSFGGNQVNFHAADGAGYDFMREQILALDPVNPQVASRMARHFERWKRFWSRWPGLADSQRTPPKWSTRRSPDCKKNSGPPGRSEEV